MTGGPISRTPWGLVLLLAATATAAHLCRVNISVAGLSVLAALAWFWIRPVEAAPAGLRPPGARE